MATGKVGINSDLKRRSWMREGLLQAASKSFWSPLSSNSKDGVVFISKNSGAGEGHTVVFDYDGNLSGRPVKNRTQATGKGEAKRKFSSSLTVDRYRLVVDNGDKFDAVDIGDLSISQHANSRSQLADLFQRVKDQMLFDAAQGANGQAPTHVIDLGSTFSYGTLLDIEQTIKTSSGFTTGGVRRPLDAYRTEDGRPCWLFVIDPAMAYIIKKDADYRTLVYNADVRGNQNRAIKGVIGKIGQLIIVEADSFFGDAEAGAITPENTGVEIAGLRQKNAGNVWYGQPGFDPAADIYSRGIILGAGALQLGFGKEPDYAYQESADFGITSESMLEFWAGYQKTKLTVENTDYKKAKVANFDYGVVAVDLKTKAAA